MPSKPNSIRSDHITNESTACFTETLAKHEQRSANYCTDSLHGLVIDAYEACDEGKTLESPSLCTKHHHTWQCNVPELAWCCLLIRVILIGLYQSLPW